IVSLSAILAGASVLFFTPYQLGTVSLVASVLTASHTSLRVSETVSISDVFLVVSAGLLIPIALCRRRTWLTGQIFVFLMGVILILLGGVLGSFLAADSVTRSLTELSKFLIAIVLVP